MRRAAHPSGCARCGAGAGCLAIKHQSLRTIEEDRSITTFKHLPCGFPARSGSNPNLLFGQPGPKSSPSPSEKPRKSSPNQNLEEKSDVGRCSANFKKIGQGGDQCKVEEQGFRDLVGQTGQPEPVALVEPLRTYRGTSPPDFARVLQWRESALTQTVSALKTFR